MSVYNEGKEVVNGTGIYYYRSTQTSEEQLTLLFLHGVTDSAACFLSLAEYFRKDYPLLLPDARAHGSSDAPEDGYSAEERAADVHGLMNRLKIRQAVVFGHAMGAETALALAADYPSEVAGVILEDPLWPGRSYGALIEERAAQWKSDIVEQNHQTFETLLGQIRSQHPLWSEEDMRCWAEARRHAHPHLVNMILTPRRRWTDYLRAVHCPLLLLTADPEMGAIVRPETVQEAAKVWKNGREVHIPQAGHFIHRDQTEAVVQAVQSFLNELSSYVIGNKLSTLTGSQGQKVRP